MTSAVDLVQHPDFTPWFRHRQKQMRRRMAMSICTVWGRRFDDASGAPVGKPFPVTSFRSADVTVKAGVGDARWSTGAAFADYDGDGWLDLFVANYVNVRLDALPEFGKGKFCEFRGIPVQCGPRGLAGSGDSLYRDKGDGTFEDVSTKAGVADSGDASAWVSYGATSTATGRLPMWPSWPEPR